MHILRMILAALLLCASMAAWSKTEKLDVLAIWDSSEYEIKDSSFSPLHRHLEVVFNHYGLRLKFVDINKNLKQSFWNQKEMSSVLGIVAWFTDNKMNKPEEFIKWMSWNVDQGRKVLLLEDIGFMSDMEGNEIGLDKLNLFFNKIGISLTGDYFENPLNLKLQNGYDSNLVEFERPISNEFKTLF